MTNKPFNGIRRRPSAVLPFLAVACLFLRTTSIPAADWPLWRCDAAATAVTSQRLADELHLQWKIQLPAQQPAWRDEQVMQFDAGYLPVVLGRKMFVTSTVNDAVIAFDTRSGEEAWRFYTEGPIRMAPAAWQDRVFVASDDGHLYCLSASQGKLLWRFRGGPPTDRRIIGNERIISTWPARGGPVVADGQVYFAAGIWPFMGTFIYALDAKTGRVVWHNDGTSFTFRRLPHYGSVAFSGLSAQGQLVATKDRLVVPGSKLTPALLDRQTGRFVGYAQGSGPRVFTESRCGFAGGQIFDVETGDAVRLSGMGRASQAVLANDAWYVSGGIYEPGSISVRRVDAEEPHGDIPIKRFEGSIRKRSSLRATPWLLAHNRLVASRNSDVQLLDTTSNEKHPPVVWDTTVDGTPWHALAADDRLFVVTREGEIYCFGAQPCESRTHDGTKPQDQGKPSGAAVDEAKRMVSATGVRDGYCLVWGLKDGSLVEALARETRLHVLAVEQDQRKVNSLRRRLDAAGLYGTRAAVIHAGWKDLGFAPYMASLVTTEDPSAATKLSREFLDRAFPALRPYGGSVCLRASGSARSSLDKSRDSLDMAGGSTRFSGDFFLVRRDRPPIGAAPWLGQNADAGNTRCSRDELVKPPLGVLWFGNALSNSLILPRHGEGPVEQVVGGRLIIEGPDSLNCTDVYTGRLLWTREFPGLGTCYNSTKHQPGAHSIGSNFFAVEDAIYVALGKSCHVLDPASGRNRRELKLPGGSTWQFLLVYNDLLIAGADPVIDRKQSPQRMYSPTSSRRIVVMERNSGKVLWTKTAQKSFRHYGICAGNDKLFCLDRTSVEELIKLERRGQKPKETPLVVALDVQTGKQLWQTDQHVGTRLTYSAEHDVLLSAGAFRGASGQVLWHTEQAELYLEFGKWGPIIRGDTIFPQVRRSMDLLTGERRMRDDSPGRGKEWKYQRSHGCGPMAGSQHLLTFRSACAGFLDTLHDGGTGNWGGFRSGCTSNLIAADGVLSAPDYTRTCSCGYQNRSSLALVHMPAVEYWTYGAIPSPGRIGINLGAPGDRRAADGTLWVAWPNVPDQMARDKTLWWGHEHAVDADYVPRSDLLTAPADATTYYHHSSRVCGEERWPWVAGSGIEGARSIKVPLVDIDTDKPFEMRLLFAEPTHEKPGQRVFDVSVDGHVVVSNLDLVRQTNGRWRTYVHDAAELKYGGRKHGRTPVVEIELRPRIGDPVISGIEVLQAETQLSDVE